METLLQVEGGAPEEPRLVPPATFQGLEPEHVRLLGAGEPVVLDGVLGLDAALAVAAFLGRRPGELTPAAVGQGAERTIDEDVRGDLTRWVARDEDPILAPYWKLVDRLALELREKAWLGIQDVEVQLAHYPGDLARYVAHHDAFAGGGRRRVSGVYYLNPTWAPGDGGELRVRAPSGEHTIEPLLDRLVLFLSEALEHEVLPTRAPRWAVTAWFLGPDQPA